MVVITSINYDSQNAHRDCHRCGSQFQLWGKGDPTGSRAEQGAKGSGLFPVASRDCSSLKAKGRPRGRSPTTSPVMPRGAARLRAEAETARRGRWRRSSKDGGARVSAFCSRLTRSEGGGQGSSDLAAAARPQPPARAMAELEHLGGKRAESARARRAEQLRRWRGSQTEQESAERQTRTSRGAPRVRFEDGAVFLAACSSGDTDEVKRLLARGADINTANVDGLTALHQVPARGRRTPAASPADSRPTSRALPAGGAPYRAGVRICLPSSGCHGSCGPGPGGCRCRLAACASALPVGAPCA